MSLKHYTDLLNHHFLRMGYSSTGSDVDFCVLGDGSRKVNTHQIYFHFNCILSYMGLSNNI